MKAPRVFVLLALLLVCIECASFRSEARQSGQLTPHQRNYNKCLHGYVGCDSSQLTDSEQGQVQQAAPPAKLQQVLARVCRVRHLDTSTTVQNPAPRYYTNKDGQRVQSPTYYDKAPTGATRSAEMERTVSVSIAKEHVPTTAGLPSGFNL